MSIPEEKPCDAPDVRSGHASSLRRRAGWTLAVVALVAAAAWTCCHWLPRKARRINGRLRVAVCQYDSRPDNYRWNIDHALRYASEAAAHGAGVVVLPEYSFCSAADVLEGAAYREMRRAMRWLGPRLARFCRAHRCYLFANIPFESKSRLHGKLKRYNRSIVYDPCGRVAAAYDKRFVAILDEFCQVLPGHRQPPVELDFGRVGMMICKDTLSPQSFENYNGVDLIVAQFGHITDWTTSTNDPPWLINDMGDAHDDFPEIAKELAGTFHCPAVFANKTGLEPAGAYTGGSCATAADGTITARAGFGGDILYVDFELDENGRIHRDAPPIPLPSPPDS